jgi:hypothetical protein
LPFARAPSTSTSSLPRHCPCHCHWRVIPLVNLLLQSLTIFRNKIPASFHLYSCPYHILALTSTTTNLYTTPDQLLVLVSAGHYHHIPSLQLSSHLDLKQNLYSQSCSRLRKITKIQATNPITSTRSSKAAASAPARVSASKTRQPCSWLGYLVLPCRRAPSTHPSRSSPTPTYTPAYHRFSFPSPPHTPALCYHQHQRCKQYNTASEPPTYFTFPSLSRVSPHRVPRPPLLLYLTSLSSLLLNDSRNRSSIPPLQLLARSSH